MPSAEMQSPQTDPGAGSHRGLEGRGRASEGSGGGSFHGEGMDYGGGGERGAGGGEDSEDAVAHGAGVDVKEAGGVSSEEGGVDCCSLLANAPVYGDHYDYHVDCDPLVLPDCAWRREFGDYCNRSAHTPHSRETLSPLSSHLVWSLAGTSVLPPPPFPPHSRASEMVLTDGSV